MRTKYLAGMRVKCTKKGDAVFTHLMLFQHFLHWACIALFSCSLVVADDPESFSWCQKPSPEWRRPFLVALVADPQIGWNKNKYNSEKLFKKAASHLKRLQPDFILVAGDLIQTPSRESQYEIAKSILDDTGIPYYAIPGNHDVRSRPELKLLNEFVVWWNVPHYWYTISHYNTLFVMLESNIIRSRDDRKADNDIRALAEEQIDWLKETLSDASSSKSYDHIVPIAHHPLALKKLNEKDRYQNTPRDVREDILDIYAEYGDLISHVFAGHYHNSAKAKDRDNDIQYITYPATGVILGRGAESGFALLQADGQNFDEDYYGYDDMPRRRPETKNASFEIVSPKKGEKFASGDQVCITWLSTSMSNFVTLEYSVNNGSTWEVVTNKVRNEGFFPWRMPSTSGNIILKISSFYDSSVSTKIEVKS